MITQTKPSRLRREILELAEAKHANGTLSSPDYRKVTLREICQPETPDITAEEIRSLRERAHVSQAVFGKYLHPCATALRGRPPLRPFSRELAALAWLRARPPPVPEGPPSTASRRAGQTEAPAHTGPRRAWASAGPSRTG